MKKLTLLGDITPAQFLRDYWQKKPLLIRQAIPGFSTFFQPEQLFAMAANAEVETRLVSQFDGRWQMQSGPFESLPNVKQEQWTLLLQGVNLHDAQADALLRQFRFIPDARLDDLMISYATTGGGVGPHFDSYDVFLFQATGQKRWRISAQTELDLVEGLPLKILRNFQFEEEFILEPGDMLYLPPQYAHEGIALNEGMTYSIGFRAPSYQELGEGFLQYMMESIDLPGRYSDPDLTATTHPAQISKQMLSRIISELKKISFDDEDMLDFLGHYFTEPKPQVFFEAPEEPLSAANFARAAKKRGVRLGRKTNMLYAGNSLFVNGEAFEIARADKASVTALADARQLDGAAVAAASPDVAEALYTWYDEGWLELA